MLFVLLALGVSVALNGILGFWWVSSRRPTFRAVSFQQEAVLVEKGPPKSQPHLHYRWRHPESGEVLYYGITSKATVLERFNTDARNALNQVKRFQMLAHLNEMGKAPIIEVYATSASRAEALRKEKQDIRDGMKRGEPLLNAENQSVTSRFSTRVEILTLDGPKHEVRT